MTTKATMQDIPAKISSLSALSRLGRVRLSRHFHMREFLYSEIGVHHGISNVPEDPRAAVRAGMRLCQNILDPLVETFGPIAVRSAYRSPKVNGYGNEHGLGCSSNKKNAARHIWDQVDDDGAFGASASVQVPWFSAQITHGRSWTDMAWWLHDHVPHAGITFFMPRAAFNIGWKSRGEGEISCYSKGHAKLLKAGEIPSLSLSERQAAYADFPPFRAIQFPDMAWQDV